MKREHAVKIAEAEAAVCVLVCGCVSVWGGWCGCVWVCGCECNGAGAQPSFVRLTMKTFPHALCVRCAGGV